MYKIRQAAYIFTHQYLNTMQQGIQSLHVVAELSVCPVVVTDGEAYRNWAMEDKTVRILNAGVGEDFNDNYTGVRLMCEQYGLPFAYFREPDIGDMMTGFGFIATPEFIARVETEADDLFREYRTDPDEHPVNALLSSFSSAK